MSRFTKTRLNAHGRTDHTCDFIAWSDLDGKSDEATNAEDLDLPMGGRARGLFEGLEPGQSRTLDGFEYFREY